MKRKTVVIIVFVVGIVLFASMAAVGFMRIKSLEGEVDDLTKQNTTMRAGTEQAQDTPTDTSPTDGTTYRSEKGVEVLIYSPAGQTQVSNPVGVIGEVPGSWSTEASFPVVLQDSNGTVITQATADVLGDWMTDELVPFSVQLTFDSTPSGQGTLVLQRDNPSGEPANDDSVSIPVQF